MSKTTCHCYVDAAQGGLIRCSVCKSAPVLFDKLKALEAALEARSNNKCMANQAKVATCRREVRALIKELETGVEFCERCQREKCRCDDEGLNRDSIEVLGL